MIMKDRENYCHAIGNNTSGINPFWIINNNRPILDCVKEHNKKGNAVSINTFDFATLYTTLEHADILEKFSELLDKSFSNQTKIGLNYNYAFWKRDNTSTNAKLFDKKEFNDLVKWLTSNTYFYLGNKVFKQCIGIPMGTDAAPFIANLFLHQMEYKFMQSLVSKNFQLAKKLKYIFRYIDDISIINDEGAFEILMDLIYPNKTLKLIKVNETEIKADVLDIQISIDNNKFHTKLFDKRRAFNLHVVNMPDFYSFIAKNTFKNVISNEIIRFFNLCSKNQDFIEECINFRKILISRNYPSIFIRKCFLNTFGKQKYKFIRAKEISDIFR